MTTPVQLPPACACLPPQAHLGFFPLFWFFSSLHPWERPIPHRSRGRAGIGAASSRRSAQRWRRFLEVVGRRGAAWLRSRGRHRRGAVRCGRSVRSSRSVSSRRSLPSCLVEQLDAGSIRHLVGGVISRYRPTFLRFGSVGFLPSDVGGAVGGIPACFRWPLATEARGHSPFAAFGVEFPRPSNIRCELPPVVNPKRSATDT